ncbi:phage tail tape measure protein [Kaistella sp. 97-N-M2]|uniref:phage tail tape measure protein n=1 Tax=Kaistella sp. 97-N-M2 TaxID=2908645 RepID=UPI001F157593|nr:phage tail tape measure protein [Kaistella sp. 97-N-M2]UJF29918.1 phage tail tape measure protein [Kaistella sp. 97-N-M2]
MASSRQIRDEIMKMTIVVNSDPAQKAIYDLSQKNVELKDRNEAVRESLKQTASTLGKNSDEYKKLTAELNQNKQALTTNEKEMERLRGEMDITQMTMAQLRKEAALLRTNLNNMVPGSQASIEMQAQLERVNSRMAEVRTGANQTRSSFRGLADTFNHYQGIIVAGLAVFAGFALSVQQVIDRNNKLVDAQTAVAKTVNMTKQEVDELTKSFSTFDTRTSRIDLLKIAETGGRLGIGKEQIREFVREVDKANVALGDGFAGGVEAVTDTLGKLKNLYGETKDLDMATAINQIGSAMNELGANGAATEQNIGEFALRLGSLPAKLKPTIAESLALGAAFEESGINAERAGTAYSTFVRNAATNSEKFAKVMGISKKEVEDLMNTDPLEFFLKFSEGMKGMDTTELAKTMEYLKMNDQYVIATMGAASENTDRFRRSIELSNQSLTKATSLTDEFNKVNNNTSAIFDKVQKKFLGMFTSEAVANTLNYLISTFGKFIGAIEDSEGTVTNFRVTLVLMLKVITIAAVSTLSYNAAIALSTVTLTGARAQLLSYTVVQKLNTALNQVGIVFQTAWNLAVGLGGVAIGRLTGFTALQTAAQQRLNLAMAANPFGAILALVTLLIGAYIAFARETEQLIDKQKILNDVKTTSISKTIDEKNEIEKLVAVAKSESATNDQRALALKRLNDIIPDHIGLLTAQNIKTAEGVAIINKYIDALNRQAYAEVVNEKKKELLRNQVDIQGKDIEKGWGNLGGVGGWLEQKLNRGNLQTEMSAKEAKQIDAMRKSADIEQALAKYIPLVREAYRKRREELIENTRQFNIMNEEQKRLIASDPGSVLGTDPKSNFNTDFTTDKKEKKPRSTEAADRRHEKEMDDMRRKGDEAAALARQIQLDIEDARIDAMNEGYDKQIDTLNLQEMRKMEEIDKKKITGNEFEIINRKIAKAKGDDKLLFQALKNSWLANNASLEELKLSEQQVFENKRKTLQYKSEKEFLADQDDLHKTALEHLQREANEEMASYTTLADLKAGLKGRIDDKELKRITTWAQGKEALNKVYQKRELELQVTHLEAMVKLYEGLDLGILTPEQRQEVMKFIDEAGNKIAEFKAKAAGVNQDDKNDKKPTLGRKAPSDVLGLTMDDWTQMFDNLQTGADKLGTVMAAVSALQNAFGAYYQFVEANEKRQLRQIEANTLRKKNTLKKQLLDGYINQETYKKLTIKADQDLEKKKAEIALKQAKRERQMAIAQTISNTAMSIMGIWAQFPKFDFGATAAIMSGVVGALGAVQLATIMSQPLPTAEGYEEGFGMEYPMTRAQDGKRFNVRKSRLRSGLVDRPTHFIAGENQKVEMVIDNPTWTSYPPQLKNAIYAANARANGYEGGFNTKSETTAKSSGNDDMMISVMSLLGKNIELLEYLRDTPPIAIIKKNAQNGKEVEDMRQEYIDLRNKNKH